MIGIKEDPLLSPILSTIGSGVHLRANLMKINRRQRILNKLSNSLIKVLDGLITVSNSLIKLSARNQEPRFPEKFC